jgi:hypothetical protein
MKIDPKQLDDILAKARAIAMGDHPADSLTVKDLKLALDPANDKLVTNDQKASIVSVVILVVSV